MVGLNSKSFALFSVLLLINIFITTGCGGSDGSSNDASSSSSTSSNSSTDSSDNSSNDSSLFSSTSSNSSTDNSSTNNDAGVYGENIYFGNQKIVGSWLVEGTQYETFNTDGTLVKEVCGAYRTIFPQYGISEDGMILTTIDSYNNYKRFAFKEANDNCFIAIKESTVYWPVEYCKYENESPATLDPISNSSASQNSLGYYGDDVQLGNKTVVGSWGFVPVNGGYGGILSFDKDGSGDKNLYSDYAVVIPVQYFVYGISNDGKELTIKYSKSEETETLQLIDTFEGCYLIILQGISYKLCKQ